VLGLRAQPGASRQLAAPLRARQIRLTVLRRRLRRHRHLGTLIADGRGLLRFAPDGLGPCQTDCWSVAHGDGVDEFLWRRQLKAVGEHSERPLDTEAGMLGQQPAYGIGIGIDPAVCHAVASQEGACGQHRRRRARADHRHDRIAAVHCATATQRRSGS